VKRITSVLAAALVVSTANAQTALMALTPNPASVVILAAHIANTWGEKTYYVKVEATGRTEEEARTQGFKGAVEEVIGSLVLKEVEVQKDTVVRNDILNYSSGYVDDYKVLSKTDQGGKVVIVMEVWVKRSKIADRLLSESKAAGKIDGERAVAQQTTLMRERQDGDRALSMVLRDYPRRAFNVELAPTRTVTNPDRTLTVQVPFVVRWDNTYLEGFYELLKKTGDGNNTGFCLQGPNFYCRDHRNYVTIQTRPGNRGWQQTVAVNDNVRFALISNTMAEKSPVVIVTVTRKSGSIAHRACYDFASPGQFVSYDPERVHINGFMNVQSVVNLTVDSNFEQVADWDKVTVTVTDPKSCIKAYNSGPAPAIYR
jgi:hypothetical protein